MADQEVIIRMAEAWRLATRMMAATDHDEFISARVARLEREGRLMARLLLVMLNATHSNDLWRLPANGEQSEVQTTPRETD
jgi:hypothetical protein